MKDHDFTLLFLSPTRALVMSFCALLFYSLVANFVLGTTITIPLHRCEFNDPCIDVQTENVTFRAILTLSNFFVHSTLGGTSMDLSISNNSLAFSYETRFHLGGVQSVGLGPASPIVSQYGSIALIHQPGNDSLVLNISFPEYTATCLPESILTLSLAAPDWMIDGTIDIIASDGRLDRPDIEPFYADITHRRHQFPRDIIMSVWNHLMESGARFSERLDDHNDSLVMTNCTSAAISTAPFIRFSFGDYPNQQQIFLYPQDYIHHNATDNTCILLFGLTETASMWILAPFTIPQANFFVNQTNLMICDSA
jgi:hypothetical protein